MESDTSGQSTIAGSVRPARAGDVPAIRQLIDYHAQRHRMLFRSLETLYEHLRNFEVFASAEGQILACCELEIFWQDLAEIKSLAVEPGFMQKGLGKALVTAALEQARTLGISRVFALTYEPQFLQRLGFKIIDKDRLPHKVWKECIKCHMQHDCKEIPLIIEL